MYPRTGYPDRDTVNCTTEECRRNRGLRDDSLVNIGVLSSRIRLTTDRFTGYRNTDGRTAIRQIGDASGPTHTPRLARKRGSQQRREAVDGMAVSWSRLLGAQACFGCDCSPRGLFLRYLPVSLKEHGRRDPLETRVHEQAWGSFLRRPLEKKFLV